MAGDSVLCRVAMIASPGSGQGKTLITAALARYFRDQGNRVQVFKVGADYLDPTILESASGQTVYNLDLWMMGQEHCRKLLFRAAQKNQVILLESLMGLHDNQPSNAELAQMFNIPIVLVLNVAKLAQTATAIVEGLGKYGVQPRITAVIGNRVGSENHHRIITEALGDIYVGSMRRNDKLELPERHLGLVQASEVSDLEDKLTFASKAIDHFDRKISLERISFSAFGSADVPGAEYSNDLQGKVIAIARDAAFSFLYAENILLLEEKGAKLRYFSPIKNEPLPQCDAVWLPGGYPELFLDELSCATTTMDGLKKHQDLSKPILAECGGMMVMCKSVTDKSGKKVNGAGLLNADCIMTARFQSIGLQLVKYENGEIRGHSFHHSVLTTDLTPDRYGKKQSGERGEPVYVFGKSVFSYMHHYFPSNPEVISKLFC